MKVINPSPSQRTFTGYVPDKKVVGNFLLKKKEVQYWDTFSFLTAVTSATGFAIGGVGLLSDYLSKENKQNPAKKNPGNLPDAFKNFDANGTAEASNGTGKGKKEDVGAKTIVPSTKFSKMGMTFAKIGIAFSGIAGIFNGVSMGLPLMAAGEALNLAASPIVETPVGTGLFGIALAAVFAGRALEGDPVLKLDKSKLKQEKGLKNKSLYVINNMKNSALAVWDSTKTIGRHIGGLFKADKKAEAMSFFRDSVFSIKPKKLVIQEFVNKDGMVKTALGFKNNPYLMHSASLVLAIGGATLALSSLMKSKTGQKVGLKTYEAGGSLDNLGLSKWGMEKAVTAGSPGAKVAGYLLGASGLTILAGQPGVDEKWGRGIQWIGTALLFSVFAVERLPKAFKTLKSKPEFNSLIRQFEVDLTQLYSNKELKQKLKSIVKAVANNEKIDDPAVNRLIRDAKKVMMKDKQKTNVVATMKNKKTGKVRKIVIESNKKSFYRPSADDILAEVKAKSASNPALEGKFDKVFKHIGNDGDLEHIKKSLDTESGDTFQTKAC